jgi:hypothetical protein
MDTRVRTRDANPAKCPRIPTKQLVLDSRPEIAVARLARKSLFATAYRAWRYVFLVCWVRLQTDWAPIEVVRQDLDERRLHVDTYVAIERNALNVDP